MPQPICHARIATAAFAFAILAAGPVLAAGQRSFVATDGVDNPAAGDRVVLRGLAINNQGSSGSGIVFDGVGQLHVGDSTIAGFAAGSTSYAINFRPTAASKLTVERTVTRSSYWGINVEPQAGATAVAAHNVLWGVTPGDDAGTEYVTLSNCVVAQNQVGIHAGAVSTTDGAPPTIVGAQ